MQTPTLNFNKVRFVTSAPDIRHLPDDSGVEVAFAGRSNAGKSSALNALTNQKNLARTSKTPGRTQLINLFELEPGKRLVDLPGYGYAQVPEEMKRKWQESLSEYLQKRESLKGLVLLMDIRHPLTPLDQQLLGWCAIRGLAVHILLTKADKLSRGAAMTVRQQVEKTLRTDYPQTSAQLFSALTRLGVAEAHQRLDEWLGFAVKSCAPMANPPPLAADEPTAAPARPD